MIKYICTAFIKFYRKYISKILKSNCIFTPTCSVYAIEALEKRNIFIAFFLIIKRILRCNHFSKGGFDPVPDSFDKYKWVI